MNAIFRVDASSKMGGGHVMRCLTLANFLTKNGWDCAFAVGKDAIKTVPELSKTIHDIYVLEGEDADEAQEIKGRFEECDWLIVDHYFRQAPFETAARSFANKIMVIDDLANRTHNCDLLLDQTYGRLAQDYKKLVPEQTRLLMGTKYALLRPEFGILRSKAQNRRQNIFEVRRLLVNLGASDPHAMTAKILQAINQTGRELIVDVVIGAGDPAELGLDIIAQSMSQQVKFHGFDANMAKLMLQADLAVGAGGSSSWERCCLGLPTLIIIIAENQEKIAHVLDEMGAAVVLCQYRKFDDDIFIEKLNELAPENSMLANQTSMLDQMSVAAFKICTGAGTAATMKAMLS